MKKLLLFLSFILLIGWLGKSIEPIPTGTKVLSLPTFRVNPLDSTLYVYKVNSVGNWGWTRVATHGEIDSLASIGYTAAQIDSLLLGKADTTYLNNLNSDVQAQLDAKPDSNDTYKYWTVGIPQQVIKYGYLYNWYAATDVRNISASNAHVPSQIEYEALLSFIDTYDEVEGWQYAGGKLKEIGTDNWANPNIGATNEVGFNARGGGKREGVFGEITNDCYYYTTDNSQLIINNLGEGLFFGSDQEWLGGSLRLIIDTPTEISGNTAIYVGNDGRRYNCVLIGTQWWLSENLAETLYRDLSPVPEVTDNGAWAALTTGARCSYDNDETNAFEYGLKSLDLHSTDSLVIIARNGVKATLSNDSLYIEGDSLTQNAYTKIATDTLLNAKEDVINKSTSVVTDGASDVKYASSKSVKDYADSKVANSIANGVTTVAPAQDTVFQALATKQNLLTNPITGTGFVKIAGTTISYDNSTYEPAFSKNTGFNLSLGTTGGTVLEGRTFGTAANSASTDFEPAISKSTGFVKWTGNAWSFDNSTYLTSLSGAVLTDQSTPQTIGATGARLAKLWATDMASRTGYFEYNNTAGTETGFEIYHIGNGGVTLQVGSRVAGEGAYIPGLVVMNSGNVGIRANSPTAYLHIGLAGTATAGTAPLKFTPAGAVLNTFPEIGAFEAVGDALYYTIPTATARKTIAFTTDITGTNSGTNTGDQTLSVTSIGTYAKVHLSSTDSVTLKSGTGITLSTSNDTITITNSSATLDPTPHAYTANTNVSFDRSLYVNGTVSTNDSISVTLSNIPNGQSGGLYVTTTAASMITFIVDNAYTLRIGENIYNTATNSYTKTVYNMTSGYASYAFKRVDNDIIIHGTQIHY